MRAQGIVVSQSPRNPSSGDLACPSVGASVLDRRVYTTARAAAILDVPVRTYRRWIDGDTDSLPVIRPERTGSDVVTWAEFVESGLLAEYRRKHKVRLAELRAFVALLRTSVGVPYPLAHARPWIGPDRMLVVRAQIDSGLPGELQLIVATSGQMHVLQAAGDFLDRVTWDEGLAATYRPGADNGSSVRCDPLLRFGEPQVKGISTSVIFAHHLSGETEREIAGAFSLAPADVRDAITYESRLVAS